MALFFTNRIFNERSCDKFVFVAVVDGGEAFDKVNVAAVADIDCRLGGSAKFMVMSAAGVCGEFYFVDMALVAGDGVAGYGCESMIMGGITAAGNAGAA